MSLSQPRTWSENAYALVPSLTLLPLAGPPNWSITKSQLGKLLQSPNLAPTDVGNTSGLLQVDQHLKLTQDHHVHRYNTLTPS